MSKPNQPSRPSGQNRPRKAPKMHLIKKQPCRNRHEKKPLFRLWRNKKSTPQSGVNKPPFLLRRNEKAPEKSLPQSGKTHKVVRAKNYVEPIGKSHQNRPTKIRNLEPIRNKIQNRQKTVLKIRNQRAEKPRPKNDKTRAKSPKK